MTSNIPELPAVNAELAIVWDTGSAVAVTSNMDGPAAQDFADHVAALLNAE
jgi:hypothetical protein